MQHRAITLQANDLEQGGIAVITPSTVTTQEEEKQAVALTFADVLIAERPKVRVITLPNALNAINRAGLAEDYREMFTAYRDTGIFAQDTLRRIGEAVGTRYLAHLNLAQFSHYSKPRWGTMGLRILETKVAELRLSLQIWDTREGVIAWEGVDELSLAREAVAEESITQRAILTEASKTLIKGLP